MDGGEPASAAGCAGGFVDDFSWVAPLPGVKGRRAAATKMMSEYRLRTAYHLRGSANNNMRRLILQKIRLKLY
jgi:hypothetical protein